jgi:hypothetical protein
MLFTGQPSSICLKSCSNGPSSHYRNLDPQHKEIVFFLWTLRVETETVQKKAGSLKTSFSVTFNKEGLQIQHPRKLADEFRLKWPWATTVHMVHQDIGRHTTNEQDIPVFKIMSTSWVPAKWEKTRKKKHEQKQNAGLSLPQLNIKLSGQTRRQP